MIRKSLFAASACLALGHTAFAEDRAYTPGEFDGIEVNHAIDVIYQAGQSYSVTVEQAGGDFSDIEMVVEDGWLTLERVSMTSRWGRHSLSIRDRHGETIVKVNGKRVPTYLVRITSPDLIALKASSSSDVSATGIDAENFKAAVSSSADLTLSGTADYLELDASSSATLNAQNLTANRLDINASSSSDVYATSLAGDLTLDASSSSDVTASNTGGNVTINASSSTDITLRGNCDELRVRASSSADVLLQEMLCLTGDLTASSSADIEAHITDSVQARASSSGDINVSGQPVQTQISKSSGGDVDFDG